MTVDMLAGYLDSALTSIIRKELMDYNPENKEDVWKYKALKSRAEVNLRNIAEAILEHKILEKKDVGLV